MLKYKVGDRVKTKYGEGTVRELDPDCWDGFTYWVYVDEWGHRVWCSEKDVEALTPDCKFKVGQRWRISSDRVEVRVTRVCPEHRQDLMVHFEPPIREISSFHVTSYWANHAELVSDVPEDDQQYHQDAGKPDLTLIPAAAVRMTLAAYEEGQRKGYEPHSWRKVPGAKDRYTRSLQRHFQRLMEAYQASGVEGLKVPDDETEGRVSHLQELAADALILLDLLFVMEEEGEK